MSYTLFVKGKITETTGGDHNVFSNKIISFNANGIISQTGEENGVTFNTPLNAPPPPAIPLNAKCIVQFRPQNNWKGEFGFDWFRIGDTSLDGDVNYETLIGQYYTKVHTDVTTSRNRDSNSWTPFFKADPQPVNFTANDKLISLKSLYGEFSYSLENDSSGNPINKKYYKPVLALLPRVPDPANPKKVLESGEAELKLYIEFQKLKGKKVKPDKIIFEMDNIIMDASHPLVNIDKHTILKNDLSENITVKITCTTSFTDDKDIKVWAITFDEAGKEKIRLSAGVLKMIAPSKKIIKEVVIVRVRTSANTGDPADLKIFKRNLKQALVIPNITEKIINLAGDLKKVIIDLSNNTKNHLNIDFNTEFGVTGTNIINEDGGTNNLSLQDYLKLELERAYPGQFTKHFKLFFLNNTCDKTGNETVGFGSTAGYSNIKSDFGIMFLGHTETTIGHECMHGLGLQHSFFGNSFLYKAQKTDNIMDYSHLEKDKVTGALSIVLDRVSTWYWQWDILNPNIIK